MNSDGSTNNLAEYTWYSRDTLMKNLMKKVKTVVFGLGNIGLLQDINKKHEVYSHSKSVFISLYFQHLVQLIVLRPIRPRVLPSGHRLLFRPFLWPISSH